MKRPRLYASGILAAVSTLGAQADSLQRIGHTTLTPRHSSPDDRGMYAAAIDPTNGYAYFIGSYLVKLDITGNLPAQVGPALLTGQSVEAAIDVAAGYVYLPQGSINRYALGTGTNAMSSAGSLALAAGTAASMAIDDSDANPSNHYAYVVCTTPGNPAKVAKVALGTFTELGSVTLPAGETNYVFCTVVDVPKHYAYFLSRGAGIPQVVKVKFTPGTNAPSWNAAVALDSTNQFIDGASIDTVHGYAYYGTYNSDTNVPGRVYKVKLEDGDVAPTVVGHVDLLAGEGRLAASVIDPAGGYVYFADDNTYPGHVYQLSLNGANVPLETSVLQLQGPLPGYSPTNGVTAGNTTTNSDGVLPYGEVFFRSAVYDPVRGNAYFGQDSRPNQIVKVQIRSAFELWQSAQFGSNAANAAVAGALADPDGDGLSNLAEYARGTDPNSPDPPGITAMSEGIAFSRNPSATDVSFSIQATADLNTNSWSSIATKIGAAPWVTIPGVTVIDPGTGPVTISESAMFTNRFYRIEITGP